MARTIFRVGIVSLLLLIPWTAAPPAGADDDGAAPPAANLDLTQNAALQLGGTPPPTTGASLPSSVPDDAIQASLGQRANVTIGTPPGGVPTADILRLRMMQQATVTAQTGTGSLVNANLSQNANLQTTGPIQGLQVNQTTQVQAAGNNIFIRMVQVIRLQAQQIDVAASQPGGQARVTQALATTFGTSAAHIRAEAAEHHLGLGELAIARALARATAGSDSRLTLRQVIALREREGGWGQVFHHLRDEGLVNEKNLGQVVRGTRVAAARSLAPKGPTIARTNAVVHAPGGNEVGATSQTQAKIRANGAFTAKASANADAHFGAGAATGRARATAGIATAGNGSGQTFQAARTRADVRDAAGHRFTEAVGHRTGPGSLTVHVRAPQPPGAHPIAITTAGNRTDVVDIGGAARRGGPGSFHSRVAGGGAAPRGQVASAGGHGRGPASPVVITSAGNGSQAGGPTAHLTSGVGSAGRHAAVTGAGAIHGAAPVAITSAANASQIGGRSAVTFTGRGEHGHGGKE